MTDFKPTHVFHYHKHSNNYKLWPDGVPVLMGHVTGNDLIEWLADAEGNVAGYSLPGHTHVVKITQ